MPRTFIYMNEKIREERPSGPVINVDRQEAGNERRTANRVDLIVNGKRIGSVRYSKRGLRSVTSHHVKAWVELEADVEVKVAE